MSDTLSHVALAWLLTYAIHSTVLLSLAWVLVRVRPCAPSAAELLWKSAMIGSIITATVQLRLDVRPPGTFSLGSAVVASSAPARAQHSMPAPAYPHPGVPSPATGASVTSSADAPPAAIGREALVVGAWALVALVLALSYAARRLILTGRIGDRRAIVTGPLFDMLGALAGNAGLRWSPHLTCTRRISSPIALGMREICVPESALTGLDAEQQRSMLAHELAHLARRDPLWMVLASLVERVLWIQPLNRLARRHIATAAEYICDDWAVRRTGSGVALARCLAQVAEWIQASPLGVPVAGMAEERSLLVSRVARLLEGAKPASRSQRLLALGAVVVLVATIALAPGVALRSARASAVGGSPTLGEPARPYTGTPRDIATVQDDGDVAAFFQPGRARRFTPAIPAVAAVPPSGGRSHAAMTPADSAIVLALVARLKDEDAEVRAAAARSLGRLEDARAVPGLIGALRDEKPRVRAAAAEALGQFQDARAIASLVALLGDANTEVKQNALDALSSYEEGVPAAGIVRLLDDGDPGIRHRAAHLAGQLHDLSATAALVKLIRDPNVDVRQGAIQALGELHDQSAAAAILAALADASADVRSQALSTLSELRAPIPEATLVTLMRDPDPDVRGRAAELAGERSVIGAIPSLRRLLDDPNAEVRQNAIGALGGIAHPAAYEALRAALASKDARVRRAAAEALGERRQ